MFNSSRLRMALGAAAAVGLMAFVGLTVEPAPRRSAAHDMAKAAQAFWSALTPEQQAKAGFEFKNEERENWHFIPKARKGLPIKEMTAGQRAAAHALLQSALSARGYERVTTIMSLEAILHELEKGKGTNVRDPELYFFTIFGKPDARAAWGWRVEGHHLSINVTIAGGAIVAAPVFYGTNPADVKDGPRKGTRALADVEDFARQLVKSLDAEQKKAVVVAEQAPKDIKTAAARRVKRDAPVGLVSSKMTDAQRGNLMTLIKAYAQNLRAELAEADLQKIEKAGADQIHFSWEGSLEPGQGHYYRLQGPTFMIEYDNTQNNANHAHSVWRDFDGDFGDDLLKKHYAQSPHDK